jgi:hypothetical protein
VRDSTTGSASRSGAVVLAWRSSLGQFSTQPTRSRFTRIYESIDTTPRRTQRVLARQFTPTRAMCPACACASPFSIDSRLIHED